MKSATRTRDHTLLVATLILAIIGVVLFSYLRLTSDQHRRMVRSEAWNACMALAEAGVEEALSHCVYNETNLISNDWQLHAGAYWLSNTLGAGYYRVSVSSDWPREIVSHGFYPIPGHTDTLSRTVRVTTTNQSVFFAGLVARESIVVASGKLRVDSYDSRDPARSTNGQYDPEKAGERGDVVCAGGVQSSGRVAVYGRVFSGPTAVLQLGLTGAVGSRRWHQTRSSTGGEAAIEPGWWIRDFNMSFPDAKLPYTTAPALSGSLSNTGRSDVVLHPGRWMTSSLSGRVLVSGNATVLVTDDIEINTLHIESGGSLTIYMAGPSARIGNLKANPAAGALRYFGLPSHHRLELQNGAEPFVGAVYAPNAELVIGTRAFCGAAVVRKARFSGETAFHFNEALREGTSRGLVITTWEEL